MAMSSTRVMGTTSLMGQAVGSAAIALKNGLSTRGVYESALSELQDKLREDDQYIPWSKRKTIAVDTGAELSCLSANSEQLINGIERGLGTDDNGAWLDDGQSIS